MWAEEKKGLTRENGIDEKINSVTNIGKEIEWDGNKDRDLLILFVFVQMAMYMWWICTGKVFTFCQPKHIVLVGNKHKT